MRECRFTTYQLYDASKSKSGYHVALCVERKTLIKSALTTEELLSSEMYYIRREKTKCTSSWIGES